MILEKQGYMAVITIIICVTGVVYYKKWDKTISHKRTYPLENKGNNTILDLRISLW